jgi:hypothetical protein
MRALLFNERLYRSQDKDVTAFLSVEAAKRVAEGMHDGPAEWVQYEDEWFMTYRGWEFRVTPDDPQRRAHARRWADRIDGAENNPEPDEDDSELEPCP